MYAQALLRDQPEEPPATKGAWQWKVRPAKNGREYHLLASRPESDTFELYGRHPTLSDAMQRMDAMHKLLGGQRQQW